MREWQSQSHVRWYCRYHVVWVPKYRKRVIFGKMRRVWELCQRHGVELIEGHECTFCWASRRSSAWRTRWGF